MEVNGSPKPEFETDDNRSYFITRLFVHEGFTKEDNERKMSEVSEKNERSLSEVLSEVLERDYWVKVKDIAMFIDYNGGITPGEARKVSGKSAATVRRYLKMLTNTGYVVSEGNTNNSVYKRNNK